MKKTEEGTQRKKRSDAKKEVKPTIELRLYDHITRIADITGNPIKDVGETFCKNGMYSRKVIEILAPKFRRDYIFHNTLFRGNPDLMSERTRKKQKDLRTTRIKMTLRQEIFDDLADIAHALDVTPFTAAGMLLRESIMNTDITNEYLSKYLEDVLDDDRKDQLWLVLDFIRRQNSDEEPITLAQMMNYIMDNFMDKSRNLKRAVVDWLDQVTENE